MMVGANFFAGEAVCAFEQFFGAGRITRSF